MTIIEEIQEAIGRAEPLETEVLVVWSGGYQVAGPGGAQIEQVVRNARMFVSDFGGEERGAKAELQRIRSDVDAACEMGGDPALKLMRVLSVLDGAPPTDGNQH